MEENVLGMIAYFSSSQKAKLTVGQGLYIDQCQLCYKF